MKPYVRMTGKVAPLPRSDVDTDQIIPARHLKRVVRTGYGDVLFEGLRRTATGHVDATFVLNQQRYRDATILATGSNFGCGSSREHAVWALLDYGFRTVIAPSFADIFRNNCYQNGVLPVTLVPSVVEQISNYATHDDEYRLTVDLDTSSVSDTRGLAERFDIDPFPRKCLFEGLDPIDLTLRHESQIQAFEVARGIAAHTHGGH